MGSKTAEKNSAQTNRQTDKLTDENNGHLAVNQKEGREREGREDEDEENKNSSSNNNNQAYSEYKHLLTFRVRRLLS